MEKKTREYFYKRRKYSRNQLKSSIETVCMYCLQSAPTVVVCVFLWPCSYPNHRWSMIGFISFVIISWNQFAIMLWNIWFYWKTFFWRNMYSFGKHCKSRMLLNILNGSVITGLNFVTSFRVFFNNRKPLAFIHSTR